MIATALLCLVIISLAALGLVPAWLRYREADRADQARHDRAMQKLASRARLKL